MDTNYNSLDNAQKRGLSSNPGNVVNFTESKGFTRGNIKKSMGFLSIMLLFALFASALGNAQVTTNSGSGLAPTYTSLANAVAALNAATISSPVVITLTGNETAPSGGYRITAQGDATNTIIIQGVTSTVTASASHTNGALNDAVFKLVGADYVTIRNFTMQENAANTSVSPAASNKMTEWGVALLYLTTTNGAQNNTIQGNTISLNKNYRNSFGIYSNSSHDETAVTTSATATGATGSNTGLSILANNISNVNLGIAVVGPTAAVDHNQTLTIGAAGMGNSITDFSTNVQLSSFANVSGSPYGILVRNTGSFTISYNTITSTNGGYVGATSSMRGIYVPTFTNAPVGTLTRAVNNNVISLRPGVANAIITGISIETGAGNDTTTLSVSNNDFNTIDHTVAATGGFLGIDIAAVNLVTNINSNTFTNLNLNTTGGVQFLRYSASRPANAVTNVNNNAIVGAFNKTGSGGTIAFYFSSSGTTPNSATETNTGNNFSNVTVTGATVIDGWRSVDGSSASPFGPSKTVTNNTFTNITGGTGTTVILQVQSSNHNTINMVANNTISNISGGGAVLGIGCRFWGSQRIENNTVTGLTSSGASVVTGIEVSNGPTGNTQGIYRNKIYNLENTNAGGSVNGILVSNGETVDVQNNIIGDLRTPNADAANPLKGISIISTSGSVNVSHNTVLLNGASTGTTFGSSALSAATTATLTLRNNILVNNSSANGTGLAAAYRRSTTDLTTYAAASNNNLFFGSTIFTDGTNTDATLTAYKTRVAARDACSVTENPQFLSTVGANANFLHIDTTFPSLTEAGGTPIAGITGDFDGDARNATTPDIGADEMNGTFIPHTTNSTTLSACDNYTWSVNGTNYTASGVYNYSADCRHTETLNLTINTTPAAPTGSSSQIMIAGDTIEDIVVVGTGIVWYPTAVDAANGTNPIAAGTALVDSTTYHAVAENGTCRSAVLAVTVTLTLATDDLEADKFRYYPNPVSNVLTIEHAADLTNVTVYTMLGQQVLTKKLSEASTKLDMSGLSAGTYLVKVETETTAQILKVVKQ